MNQTKCKGVRGGADMLDIANNANLEKLLTEHELARMVDMSIYSIRRWRLKRIGPRFLKISSRPGLRGVVRYRPDDVRAWLDTRPGDGGRQVEIQ